MAIARNDVGLWAGLKLEGLGEFPNPLLSNWYAQQGSSLRPSEQETHKNLRWSTGD